MKTNRERAEEFLSGLQSLYTPVQDKNGGTDLMLDNAAYAAAIERMTLFLDEVAELASCEEPEVAERIREQRESAASAERARITAAETSPAIEEEIERTE